MRTFHRFRSTHTLLEGHHELENQEIYFASPEQLNDPMEGFKDICWYGDDIVWKNLLKHYLLCLEHVCSLFVVGGKNYSIKGVADIPVFKTEEQLPTPQSRELFGEILDRFLSNCIIGQCVKNLSKRSSPVRRSELLTHFKSFHLYALESVFAVYEFHRLIDKRSSSESIRQMAEKALSESPLLLELANEIEQEHPGIARASDILFSATAHTSSQLDFITRYNSPTPEDKNKSFIFFDFPEAYIQKVEGMVYPDWYTACFMSQYSNSSVWGNYGDKHKGVCLSFKAMTEGDHSFIRLYGINGWENSGPIYEKRNHMFYKIDYEKKPVEVDFFRSLGRLPRPVLMKCWYTDENGSRSACADELFKSEDQWRDKYWPKFYQGITTKLRDWSYEEEYRLILSSFLVDLSDPARRKLKYDFNDLESITFGINTSTQDKLDIVKIIESKCRSENRKDFEFYQAHYNWQKGAIERSKMSLLNFA